MTTNERAQQRDFRDERAREPERVTAFWRELGLPGLIDVHTHFMPANVTAKVWAYFDTAAEKIGRPWPVSYRGSEDDRIQTLRSFGVRRFSSLTYPHKPDMARWLNEWCAKFAARTPDCLHSATFYPEPDAAAYVQDALEGGAQIFKAHLQVGSYDPRDALLDPVWGQLAESGVPVVVHCSSGTIPGPFTGAGPIASVLSRHPRLKAVIAHMGTPEYIEFLDLADAYPEVFLDTSATLTDPIEEDAPLPGGALPRLADLGERILFGSDFPLIPYPYLHQLEALARIDLGDAWLRAVCHDNAARLLGIGSS